MVTLFCVSFDELVRLGNRLALAPNGPEKWGCRTHVEWEFETYIVKFETYSVKRDYETKKTAGALEPPEPPSLAPMNI